eukprot:TRINITY_DN6437_c0_g1_i1.p1 TRINITY_DN6437_c0_g1~~TRINITY_DN6437_c0_g1_i1.p1  ORF type:complete len:295 (-),score=57.94 TRINITY_DN6437_c0_g1_i1:135-1019(-)
MWLMKNDSICTEPSRESIKMNPNEASKWIKYLGEKSNSTPSSLTNSSQDSVDSSLISSSASPTSLPSDSPSQIGANKRKLYLMTVISKWDSFEQRALVRQVYGNTLRQYNGEIDLVFVVGKPEEKWNMTVGNEQKFHKDIIILDQDENMNNGKTLRTFQTLHKLMPYAYDFVVKLDTDSFLLVVPFTRFLITVSKTSTYGGPLTEMFWEKVVKPTPLWAPGGFYFLSWDLVDFLSDSPYAYENRNGPEDVQTAWMVRNASCQNYVSAWYYQHGMKDPKSWWIEIGKAMNDGKLV